MTGVGMFEVLPGLLLLFYIVMAGLGLYALILFIKLARRASKPWIFIFETKGEGSS